MTIWIIGFLFTVGFVGSFSDDKPFWIKLVDYAALAALWPLDLGIEIRSMIESKEGKQ